MSKPGRTYHVKSIRKNTKLAKQGYSHSVVFRDSEAGHVLHEGLHSALITKEDADNRAEYLTWQQAIRSRRAKIKIVALTEYCMLSPKRGKLQLVT